MIIFILLSFIVCFVHLCLTRNIKLSASIYLGLILSSWMFIFKVPGFEIIQSINFLFTLKIIIYAIAIYILCNYLYCFQESEVGYNVSDLLTDILPDRRLNIFGLFFITQLAPSGILIFDFIIVYYVGLLLRLDKLTITIVTSMGLMLNILVDKVQVMYLYPDISVETLTQIQLFNQIVIQIIYLLAFIVIIIAIFFSETNRTSIFNILKQDYRQLLSLTILFIVAFNFLSVVVSINFTIKILSIMMFAYTSYLSRHYMNDNKKEVVAYDRKHPYIYSLMVYGCNILILFYIKKYVIVSFIALVVFNHYVAKFYKIEMNFKKVDFELIKSLCLIVIAIIITIPIFAASGINNFDFGTSFFDVINHKIISSSNHIVEYILMVAYTNFMSYGDFVNLISVNVPLIYYVAAFYFFYLLMPLNLFMLFFTKVFAKLDEELFEDYLISIFGFSLASSLIVIILLYLF